MCEEFNCLINSCSYDFVLNCQQLASFIRCFYIVSFYFIRTNESTRFPLNSTIQTTKTCCCYSDGMNRGACHNRNLSKWLLIPFCIFQNSWKTLKLLSIGGEIKYLKKMHFIQRQIKHKSTNFIYTKKKHLYCSLTRKKHFISSFAYKNDSSSPIDVEQFINGIFVCITSVFRFCNEPLKWTKYLLCVHKNFVDNHKAIECIIIRERE